MNLNELKLLVADGESETLEFKKSTNSRSLAEAGRTLCGFLNKDGGVLLFGVTDQGGIVGQEVTDKTKIEIAENVLKDFNPYAPVKVEYIDCGANKQVILLKTEDNTNPPYYYKSIAYRRSGTTTQIMPPSFLEELLEAKKWSTRSWEKMPAIGFSIDDLDHEELSKVIELGIRNKKIPPGTNSKDIVEILKKFELIKDGQINNAAVVLFAKNPTFQYAQCLLRLARFRGLDKSEFIDNQQVHANAFKMLQAVEDFCERHLPVASRFIGKMHRLDEPFLPPKAIREAIMNCICHRDYSIYAGAINFAIYDDRIEIESDGKVPRELAGEDLKSIHRSVRRNPLICGVFYRMGLIEQWGRGIQQIVQSCIEAGHPEPEFIEAMGAVKVTLFAKEPMRSRVILHSETEEVLLTKRQQQIIDLLKSNKTGAQIRTMVQELAISRTTMKRELEFLEQKGLVRKEGDGRSATWYSC